MWQWGEIIRGMWQGGRKKYPTNINWNKVWRFSGEGEVTNTFA
jgi:hypothetical protein